MPTKLSRRDFERVLQGCRTSGNCPRGCQSGKCIGFDAFAIERLMVVFGRFDTFLTCECIQAICRHATTSGASSTPLTLEEINKALNSQLDILQSAVQSWLEAVTEPSKDQRMLQILFFSLVASARHMKRDTFPQGSIDLVTIQGVEEGLEELERLGVVRRNPENGWWEPTVLAHRFAREWVDKRADSRLDK